MIHEFRGAWSPQLCLSWVRANISLPPLQLGYLLGTPEVDNTSSSVFMEVYPGGILPFLKHSQHEMAEKRTFVSSIQGGKLRCSWEQEASSQKASRGSLCYRQLVNIFALRQHSAAIGKAGCQWFLENKCWLRFWLKVVPHKTWCSVKVFWTNEWESLQHKAWYRKSPQCILPNFLICYFLAFLTQHPRG